MLDSYALLAYLCHEKGAAVVLDLFERATRAKQVLFISAPNWAEIRYRMEQKLGEIGWRQAQQALVGFPLEVVPTDQALAELSGEIKVKRKMSLADCFAAALAKQKSADLYTGDPEFKAIEKDVRIVWL